MTFWVVRCGNMLYQFNTPPSLDTYPYYDCVQRAHAEYGGDICDALNLECADYYNRENCPIFLNMDFLADKEITKVSLVVVANDDEINKSELKEDLESLDPEILQGLYEEVSKVTNKPYVSNNSELTPEKVREFLVTNTDDVLFKLTDKGTYPLQCLLRAFNNKDIYNTLGSIPTLYSDVKNNILKDMPVQDMACFIGKSGQEYIEALSKYLPASAVNIINEQKLHTITDVVSLVKSLNSYELGNLISMLPMDKVEKLKRSIDSKMVYNSTSVNSEKKTSLVDKLKNNKLI